MTMAAALEQKIVTPDTGVIVPVRLPRAGIRFKDLNTKQSSLEEIFVSLVRDRS